MRQIINWRHAALLALMAVGLYLVGGEVESEAVFLPSSRSGWLRSGRCTACMSGGGEMAKSPGSGHGRPIIGNRKIVQQTELPEGRGRWCLSKLLSQGLLAAPDYLKF